MGSVKSRSRCMPLTLKGQDQDSISKRGGNVLLKPNYTPILVLLEGVKKP